MCFVNNINYYINQVWLKKYIIWPHPKYVEIYTQKFVAQILFVITNIITIIMTSIIIIIMLKIVLLLNIFCGNFIYFICIHFCKDALNRQGKFIYTAHFIHNGNSKCFT